MTADADGPVRVRTVTVLSDDHYVLRKTVFDLKRRDGTWATMSRETYDRGSGAAILLRDLKAGLVLPRRQFRYPAYVNGHHGEFAGADRCGGGGGEEAVTV